MTVVDDTNFRDLLTHDHARLDAMLTSILEVARAGVQPKLDEQWAAYEDSVLAHIDAEEMFLLPGLAVHEPRLASRIRDEHTKFRSLLAEVGIGLELHIVRENQILELTRSLREHAQMEEHLLYVWADTTLPTGRFASVARRLRATWARLAKAATHVGEPGADGHASEPVWGVSRRF